MKKDKKEIKEPYPPEKTPNPPQIIDPSREKEKNEEGAPENQLRGNPPAAKTKSSKGNGNKLLSDDADISDETTI